MPKRDPAMSDEAVLDMVRRRCAGESSGQIAARYGIPSEKARVATTRVRNADLEESGEPARVILAAYWR